jgi:YbbR domain-containing protein
MLRWLWKNLGSLVLAFILALTVWVAAVNADDPTEVRQISSPISIEYINLPSGILIINSPAQQGQVSVRAPLSVWNQLTPQDIHLQVDLSGLTAGSHDLPVAHWVDRQPARLAKLDPQTVRVVLEAAGSKSVPVMIDVVGDPALGYQADLPTVSPGQAQVVGPASDVSRVHEVRATVEISNQRDDVSVQAKLLPVTSDGQQIEDLTVDPAQAAVSVHISQRGGFREVVVKVVVEGQVDPGFRLTNVTVSPPIVTVYSSDPNAVAALPGYVETEPLLLTGTRDDIERRLAIHLPSGISLVGDQTVLVQVNVAAIETSRTISHAIEIQGLGAGLYASPSPDTVNVILTGPLTTLETLQVDSLRVVLDLLDLGPGTHQVAPQVIGLPVDVVAETVLPSTVEVVIASQPLATPSSTATPTP